MSKWSQLNWISILMILLSGWILTACVPPVASSLSTSTLPTIQTITTIPRTMTPEPTTIPTITMTATSTITPYPTNTPEPTLTPTPEFILPLVKDAKGNMVYDTSIKLEKLPLTKDLSSDFILRWHNALIQAGLVTLFTDVCKYKWVLRDWNSFWQAGRIILDPNIICHGNQPIKFVAAFALSVPEYGQPFMIGVTFEVNTPGEPQLVTVMVNSIRLYLPPYKGVKIFQNGYYAPSWEDIRPADEPLFANDASLLVEKGWYDPEQSLTAAKEWAESGYPSDYYSNHVVIGDPSFTPRQQ